MNWSLSCFEHTQEWKHHNKEMEAIEPTVRIRDKFIVEEGIL